MHLSAVTPFDTDQIFSNRRRCLFRILRLSQRSVRISLDYVEPTLLLSKSTQKPDRKYSMQDTFAVAQLRRAVRLATGSPHDSVICSVLQIGSSTAGHNNDEWNVSKFAKVSVIRQDVRFY